VTQQYEIDIMDYWGPVYDYWI